MYQPDVQPCIPQRVSVGYFIGTQYHGRNSHADYTFKYPSHLDMWPPLPTSLPVVTQPRMCVMALSWASSHSTATRVCVTSCLASQHNLHYPTTPHRAGGWPECVLSLDYDTSCGVLRLGRSARSSPTQACHKSCKSGNGQRVHARSALGNTCGGIASRRDKLSAQPSCSAAMCATM